MLAGIERVAKFHLRELASAIGWNSATTWSRDVSGGYL